MARPPKATQPPALAELPSRQFYTLKEAAAELNRIYGRTDIDENYILQLVSMGRLSLHWICRQNQDRKFFFLPDLSTFNSSALLENNISDEDQFLLDEITSSFIFSSLSMRDCFIELSYEVGFRFIFEDKINSEELYFENICLVDFELEETINREKVFGNIYIYEVKDLTLKNKDFVEKYTHKVEREIAMHVDKKKDGKLIGSSKELMKVKLSVYNFDFLEEVMNFYCADKSNLFYKDFNVNKDNLCILGKYLDEFKNGTFKQRHLNPRESSQRKSQELTILQMDKTRQFRASKAASAIALLCLHKDLKLDNHSTIATQLLARLPESLTELIGSSSMIDMLKEAKDLLERIEQVQAAEKLVNKNQSKLD